MTIPITILIVEDEQLVRMNMADEFFDLGFTVLEAGNAQDALVILGSQAKVTVLFTDIDMPGAMDGLMLAQAVHEQWPMIKIIVTSGHRKVEADQMPRWSRFFGKPSNTRDVATAMHEMVD